MLICRRDPRLGGLRISPLLQIQRLEQIFQYIVNTASKYIYFIIIFFSKNKVAKGEGGERRVPNPSQYSQIPLVMPQGVIMIRVQPL